MTARESLTVGAGAVVVVGAWLAAVRLLVAVRAILAPLRALHPSRACGCDDPDCPLTCRECLQVHPCPTARLLDAIEADLIGDAS